MLEEIIRFLRAEQIELSETQQAKLEGLVEGSERQMLITTLVALKEQITTLGTTDEKAEERIDKFIEGFKKYLPYIALVLFGGEAGIQMVITALTGGVTL